MLSIGASRRPIYSGRGPLKSYLLSSHQNSGMTLRKNKLRERLRKGEPTIGTHIQCSWPTIVEIVGQAGSFHYVEFTSTYGPYDLYALENLGRAAELCDLTAMIKVDADPKVFVAQRAVGSGFQSILFADLRSIEEVEEAIRAVRAEPEGWNGCSMERADRILEGGTRSFVKYCDDVVVAIMVEKRSLYDKLEDLMNLERVDIAMSNSLHTQYSHPTIVEAERRIIKTALKYDKHPRVELGGSQPAFEKSLKKYMSLGVRDFSVGQDTVILQNWWSDFGRLTAKTLGTQ